MLVLAGCAADPSTSSVAVPSSTPGHQPDDGGDPEEVIATLQRYASQHPDEFGGLYVDPPGTNSVVMLFTDRLDEHAAALAAISPRVTVREAQYTEAELVTLLESIDLAAFAAEGIEPLSAGLDTINNRVTLEVKSDDPTLELQLEARYGGRVEVTVHPLPGEWANAEGGEGWRLLAAGEAGPDEAYSVRAATDAPTWNELWTTLALTDEQPQVDLEREVVVSFGHAIGSGCREVRLDDVVIEGGVVFSMASDPLAPRACTADLAGAVVFVVAVERAALPPDGFTLQLTERQLTGPDSGFSEVIEVPLP